MKNNKYEYNKVIQQNWGYGQWDDVDFYECDSTGWISDTETRLSFKENLKLYRENQPVPTRVIVRRELKAIETV